MPEFIPGLKLNQLFYDQVVRPLMQKEFPGLVHAAARIGAGSEVLGYDDHTSTDHDWGLRLQIFLAPKDHELHHEAINQMLRHRLPAQFRGFPTSFGPPDEEGTRLMEEGTGGPVEHRLEIVTLRSFLKEYMAFDPQTGPTALDWLVLPQQHLLAVTSGQVYADPLGELKAVRDKLSYYPDDVWFYLMAMQWVRISQEEHFVGRTGSRGDELGSQLLASRLVHDMMQLCFFMARQYAPYPKWFGTAFAQLPCAPTLLPIFRNIFAAQLWPEREEQLCRAYEIMAAMHNQLGITEPLSTAVSYFFGRPFRVISGGRFVAALQERIKDETLRAIPTNIGSIDQFCHSTDLRSYPDLHMRLKVLYQ